MIEVCFDSTTEANLRYLYATGFIDSDTILCCPDDYSLGNFKNFSINERYEQLCKYGVVDYGKRNKEYFYNATIHNYRFMCVHVCVCMWVYVCAHVCM